MLSIVSANGQAFEFTCQRSMGEEQLPALKATIYEASLKLTDLVCNASFLRASLVSMWVSVNATWLCCTHFDGPWMQLSWPPSLVGREDTVFRMSQMLLCSGLVPGFLSYCRCSLWSKESLTRLLCPHQPFPQLAL